MAKAGTVVNVALGWLHGCSINDLQEANSYLMDYIDERLDAVSGD